MSTLKTIEKKYFEDLFDLSSGYVLDFNRNTFSAFFRDIVGIDIYALKYALNGDSKAKRLRAFWEIETDIVVGKILSELLELWKYQKSKEKSTLENGLYETCLKIVNRLVGKNVDELNHEKIFLEKDFGNISIRKLPLESNLISILEKRLEEARRCHHANSSLAVIFLAGSVLEGILLGIALKYPSKFNQAKNAPRDKSEKVKRFHEWSLAQLIDVAYELEFLKLDVKKFSHELRDFRNYIHPYQQMTSKFQPDKHTAEICLQVLNAAIAGLNGERK